MADLGDDVDREREVAELRAANLRLQRSNARLKEREADLVDAVYQAAKDAAVTVGKASPIPRPSRDRRKGPEVALLHLTDWQCGKRTPGPDGYSTDVCIRRVGQAVQKTIKLSEIQRADHPVREIVVMLGGDMVEGVSVFPGNHWEIDSQMFSQVFTAAGLVESVVTTLLGSFEKVTVAEVAGNHGRIGRKGDSPRGDNWDRVVYKIARERIGSHPRLEWEQNDNWYAVVSAGGFRALLVHGDQVKSFGGNVPAYGVLRKANAWASGAIPEEFSAVYLGHMHQPMALQMANGSMCYMTPSTESGSAYAREFMAAHGKPGQRLQFIDPRGDGKVTADYLLWLD